MCSSALQSSCLISPRCDVTTLDRRLFQRPENLGRMADCMKGGEKPFLGQRRDACRYLRPTQGSFYRVWPVPRATMRPCCGCPPRSTMSIQVFASYAWRLRGTTAACCDWSGMACMRARSGAHQKQPGSSFGCYGSCACYAGTPSAVCGTGPTCGTGMRQR